MDIWSGGIMLGAVHRSSALCSLKGLSTFIFLITDPFEILAS